MARNPSRNQPSAANPDPTASLTTTHSTIRRPDKSTFAPGNRPAVPPPTFDGSVAATRSAPLGRQTSGGR